MTRWTKHWKFNVRTTLAERKRYGMNTLKAFEDAFAVLFNGEDAVVCRAGESQVVQELGAVGHDRADVGIAGFEVSASGERG